VRACVRACVCLPNYYNSKQFLCDDFCDGRIMLAHLNGEFVLPLHFRLHQVVFVVTSKRPERNISHVVSVIINWGMLRSGAYMYAGLNDKEHLDRTRNAACVNR